MVSKAGLLGVPDSSITTISPHSALTAAGLDIRVGVKVPRTVRWPLAARRETDIFVRLIRFHRLATQRGGLASASPSICPTRVDLTVTAWASLSAATCQRGGSSPCSAREATQKWDPAATSHSAATGRSCAASRKTTTDRPGGAGAASATCHQRCSRKRRASLRSGRGPVRSPRGCLAANGR
jgi:hypothetical protein